MRHLVIDTATPQLSVALFDGPACIAHDHRTIGRGHAEHLIPAIAALPDGGRADAIVVGCGPGSFTGIRIAIAAARALALGWNATLSGISTPGLLVADALSRGALAADEDYSIVMEGGHGEWALTFADGRTVSAPQQDAHDAISTAVILGEQSEAIVAQRGSGRAVPAAVDARAWPFLPAWAMLSAATPHYLRAPDAALPQGPATV